jgi:Family of unknown function (DUF5906)
MSRPAPYTTIDIVIASVHRVMAASPPQNRLAAFRFSARDLWGYVKRGVVAHAYIADALQAMADEWGLVETHGQDEIAAVMADAIDDADDDLVSTELDINAASKRRLDLRVVGDQPDRQPGVGLDDFYAYMPKHSYIYTPSREMWPAASVNPRIPPVPEVGVDGAPILDDRGKPKHISAAAWLDRNKPVEQMTWAPGHPSLIRDRLISEGGWVPREGVACFNLYRPAMPEHGAASKAGPWVDHVAKIYGDDTDHIVRWLAHRVQRPQEKINHALVLGGNQGVGKDTLLEPVKQAVGPWNFFEVSPKQLLGRFNGFLKSVILRVNEARDLGDVDRFQFYDHTKAYIAAPPDVLRVDEKHLAEHSILNCVGVIITSNYKSDGIYLPPDDRRHFVAWSDLTRDDFAPNYWNSLWGLYESGGYGHVAAYLAGLDLASFDPKATPPKTAAFWDIVGANRAPEDAELADTIDELGSPAAITIEQIGSASTGSFQIWITDRRNRRQIPHRMEKCNYVPVRNEVAQDGLWKIEGKRRAVYARRELSIHDRQAAAGRRSRSRVGRN